MKQSFFFKNAVWVKAPEKDGAAPEFAILRGHFEAKKGEKATLFVLGLGWFRAYINGVLLNPDSFLPLSSDYEARPEPSGEVLTGHRIYVPSFDISALLRDGDNVLALHCGGGWYTYKNSYFGSAKAIWRIALPGRDAVSSTDDRFAESFIKEYRMERFETQDLTDFDFAVFGADLPDASFPRAVEAKPLETEYLETDCPADKAAEIIYPVPVCERDGVKVYDCRKNLSGRPVIKLPLTKGETVRAVFSEELNEDLLPHPAFNHRQVFSVVSDGSGRTVTPQFGWYGFRYFSLTSSAEVEKVEYIRSDVKVTSFFESGSETLNKLYSAFVNTQLANMHGGIPSDCPHIERRGYTGDGQGCCRSVMTVLDAEKFYRKWIDDISDCQDSLTGHVQYTAPYIRSGGGPGGWGCAIVEVPYQFWLAYGDPEPFKRLYPQMMKYFSYLEAHSEFGLVTSDREGEWCLGDWCTPKKIEINPAFVNNYFYVRSMRRILAFSDATGFECDRALLEKRIAERSAAIKAAYWDVYTSSFLGGAQGADAFALDIGLGNEKTLAALAEKYSGLGEYDTGIFGTEIVTRILFERGYPLVAASLLTSEGEHSFAAMFSRGATTLWEYFPGSLRDRSHDHPMFGAVTALLFDQILGIGQPEGSAGFEKIVIAPKIVPSLGYAKGRRMTPKGEVSVGWKVRDKEVRIEISVPGGVPAKLLYGCAEYELKEGENKFVFEAI